MAVRKSGCNPAWIREWRFVSKADCCCLEGSGGPRIEVFLMPIRDQPRRTPGIASQVATTHVELRRLQDPWEHRVISLKEHRVLKERRERRL
jgi:hypothetical protein